MRVLCAAVLALHLAAGIGALVMLPRGFAADDLHLWSNTVIPIVASLAVIASVIAWRTRALSFVIAACAGGWIVAVPLGAILFPSSITGKWIAIPAVIALAIAVLAWRAKQHAIGTSIASAIGGALGAIVILAQRAPLPSTRPLGGTLATVIGEPTPDAVATIEVCGLRVEPLLTFVSISPDRTWTILSPEFPARRRLTHYEPIATGYKAAFTDSTLVVHERDDGVELEAITTVAEPVYSHLNSFTTIVTPPDATISFGGNAHAIEPADYPSGRPIKLAYLDDALHVVRASDAEKGPFEELETRPLRRGDPLVIEIRTKDRACRLTFEDWTAQVSVEPSPTAGWGVPQNSIQFFSRFVLLALAETGPGRGFDSVGHAAGTYRNRVRIEAIR